MTRAEPWALLEEWAAAESSAAIAREAADLLHEKILTELSTHYPLWTAGSKKDGAK